VPIPVSALPAVPGTAQALAAALVVTEGAIHDPGTPLAAVPALGATEQRLVATLASHPAWAWAVGAALSPNLLAAASGAATADAELSAVPGPTPTAIPPWTIVTPRPADELLADYRQAQAATAIPWTVLAAINLEETRMGRIVGPSSAGAQGPMQFLPSTWARDGAGGDIRDAGAAIAAAARFLRANGGPGNLSTALYHYNPSDHYVRAVLALSAVMATDVRAFYGYYGWRVFVGTTSGTYLLPEGYSG
jgi:membrane-bound lytic murein transglycosylase B